jgi:hypothetical protein
MPSVDSTTSANYLKAAPSTQFGTRQLQIISILQAGVHTTFANADSLFSKTVRAVQQTAEIYAVGTPTSTGGGTLQMIIATDTQWSGATGNATIFTDDTYALFEAAILAGSGVAGTVTNVAL